MKLDPAFPQSLPSGPNEGNMYYYGISRRDYFAAKAMQGMWAGDTHEWNCSGKHEALEGRAKTAYAMADAMIAASQDALRNEAV